MIPARAKNAYYAASVLLILFFPLICRACGDGNLPPQKAFARFWINLVFLNLMAAYALLFINRKAPGPLLSKKDWLLFGFIGLLLCALPPIFSGDLHEYLMRGRILGVYHENPYLVPKDYPDDSFYKLTVWVGMAKLPENYGPAWSVVQWVAPTVFRHSYLASIFFFKAILFLFLAGSVWFFDKTCRITSPQNAGWMTPFFALNPILIDHILIDGHNDIVMVFWLIFGFYLFLRGRYYWAVAACTTAVLVKFTAVVFLPALGVFYLKRQKINSPGAIFLVFLKSLAVFFAVSFALYFPFWVGPATLSYFSKFGDWFASNSIPYAFLFLLNKLGVPAAQEAVKRFFMFFFVANCLGALLCMVFRRSPDEKAFCRAISWMFVIMYVSYAIPFYGHHLLWALPFLILSELPRPVLWASLYGVTGLFFYFKRPSALFLAGLAVYGIITVCLKIHDNIRHTAKSA